MVEPKQWTDNELLKSIKGSATAILVFQILIFVVILFLGLGI